MKNQPEINVAHICLFEEWTWKVLIQHNNKFDKSAFVWGKCEWKNNIDTILDEMWDEIGYCLLAENIVKVMNNTREVWWKICHGTIFAWILPKDFISVDLVWEWKSEFYDLSNAPLDDFITWDTREKILEIIEKCYQTII